MTPPKAQHTPTPWEAKEPYGAICAQIDGKGRTVAMTDNYYKPTENAPFPSAEEARANARLIVQAVNERAALLASHERLKSALGELFMAQDSMTHASDYLPGERRRRLDAAMKAARAALSLAKEVM